VRVYLAASFSRQSEMRVIALRLEMAGVCVTSRWLHENQGMKHGNAREKFMRECAFTDLQDVRDADMLVRFTDDLIPSTIPSYLGTGARHFETGYALALGKPIVVVGGRQNVFDFLPNVVHIKDADALVRYLSPEEIH
jgi:nucleoside 2-deoxyribosyltransferase